MDDSPPYSEEGAIYGKYIVAKIKKPKIAVLYQDDYGATCSAGCAAGSARRRAAIVREELLDPTSTDVQPQVTQLKASGANVFMSAFGKFSLQAFDAVSKLNWKPQIFVDDVSCALGPDVGRAAEGCEQALSRSCSARRSPAWPAVEQGQGDACPAEMAARRCDCFRTWPARLGGGLADRAARMRRRGVLQAGVGALCDRLARQLCRPGAPRRGRSDRSPLTHAPRRRPSLACGRGGRVGGRGTDARACPAHRRGRIRGPRAVVAGSAADPRRGVRGRVDAHQPTSRRTNSAASADLPQRRAVAARRSDDLPGWIGVAVLAR